MPHGDYPCRWVKCFWVFNLWGANAGDGKTQGKLRSGSEFQNLGSGSEEECEPEKVKYENSSGG